MINSNAEAPVAKRHKRIVNWWGRRGHSQTELQNENSEIEGDWTAYHDDEEIFGSDGDEDDDKDDEFDRDCDEAPANVDVRIWETHPATGPSTHERRRSSHLNNTEGPIVGGEDN